MPEQEHHSWIHSVFGVDPGKYVDAAAEGLKSAGQSVVATVHRAEDAIVDGAKAAGHAVVEAAKKVEAAGEGVVHAVVEGVKAAEHKVEEAAKAVGADILAHEVASYEAAMKDLDAQIKAVTDAGLNAQPYVAQAKQLRADFAAADKIPGLPARALAVGKMVLRAHSAASDAKKDVARVKKSANEGIGKAATDMRDGAKSLIDKMADGDTKKDLNKRLADLDAEIAGLGKVTDPAAHTKQAKKIGADAEALLDAAAGANKDSAAVQAIYKKALEDRYGFKINNPDKMKNTHLDQVYKMFDKVPDTDVIQGKLKDFTYQPLDDKGKKNSGAAYGGAEIFMGDYGKETWDYTNPETGKPDKDKDGNEVQPNGFSISTLHELGHSVDDRFGIMSSNQGKSGGGGWRKESIGSVGKAFVAQFTAGAGKAVTIEPGVLSGLVEQALGGKNPGRPDKLSDADWATVKTMLQLCLTRRNDQWPWGSPHDVDGRTYHEAYAGQWWSYETAVRAKALTVRDYQWRAPGEWFAELYAYSYYNSRPPPNGVDAGIAAYMFGGKAAEPPAAKH